MIQKMVLLFTTVLVFPFLTMAQTNSEKQSENGLPREFFQRWKLNYGIANGDRIQGLPQSPSNDYEFKSNGEYLLYNDDGTYMTGLWEYNATEKVVYTKRSDGELNGKIIEITKNSIILVPAGEAVKGTPFESFRFYYIPKAG